MFILIDGRRSSIEDRRDDPLAKSKKWNATVLYPHPRSAKRSGVPYTLS